MDQVQIAVWRSPLGWIGFAATARGMVAITVPRVSRRAALAELQHLRAAWGDNAHLRHARRELERYFAGDHRANLDAIALDFSLGTPFEQQVWRIVRAIPYGETRTYGEIARAVGKPRAARAVGQCNAKNPWAIVVPCHRVVGSNGALTGYGGGMGMKKKLLELEGIEVDALDVERQRRGQASAHRD